MLTHEIQVAHHQHKEKSMELISTLLERMNSDRKDEGSQVLREVILKFIGNKWSTRRDRWSSIYETISTIFSRLQD